jgi:hypothetical protein
MTSMNFLLIVIGLHSLSLLVLSLRSVNLAEAVSKLKGIVLSLFVVNACLARLSVVALGAASIVTESLSVEDYLLPVAMYPEMPSGNDSNSFCQQAGDVKSYSLYRRKGAVI